MPLHAPPSPTTTGPPSPPGLASALPELDELEELLLVVPSSPASVPPSSPPLELLLEELLEEDELESIAVPELLLLVAPLPDELEPFDGLLPVPELLLVPQADPTSRTR